jgi:hypothetical protein
MIQGQRNLFIFDVIFQKNWSDVINETKRKKKCGKHKIQKKKNTLTWNNIIFFFLLIILIFFGSHHFFIPIDFYVVELIRNFWNRNGWGFRWFLNWKIIGNSTNFGFWGFPVSTQYSHPRFLTPLTTFHPIG